MYAILMHEVDPDRRLVVVVSEDAYHNLLAKPSVALVLKQQPVPFVVVNLTSEEVVSWTS